MKTSWVLGTLIFAAGALLLRSASAANLEWTCATSLADGERALIRKDKLGNDPDGNESNACFDIRRGANEPHRAIAVENVPSFGTTCPIVMGPGKHHPGCSASNESFLQGHDLVDLQYAVATDSRETFLLSIRDEDGVIKALGVRMHPGRAGAGGAIGWLRGDEFDERNRPVSATTCTSRPLWNRSTSRRSFRWRSSSLTGA